MLVNKRSSPPLLFLETCMLFIDIDPAVCIIFQAYSRAVNEYIATVK